MTRRAAPLQAPGSRAGSWPDWRAGLRRELAWVLALKLAALALLRALFF